MSGRRRADQNVEAQNLSRKQGTIGSSVKRVLFTHCLTHLWSSTHKKNDFHRLHSKNICTPLEIRENIVSFRQFVLPLPQQHLLRCLKNIWSRHGHSINGSITRGHPSIQRRVCRSTHNAQGQYAAVCSPIVERKNIRCIHSCCLTEEFTEERHMFWPEIRIDEICFIKRDAKRIIGVGAVLKRKIAPIR